MSEMVERAKRYARRHSLTLLAGAVIVLSAATYQAGYPAIAIVSTSLALFRVSNLYDDFDAALKGSSHDG